MALYASQGHSKGAIAMLRSRNPDPAVSRTRRVAVGEIALIGRVARGDRDAFAALYLAYHPRLTRFLDRVTRRPQLVEELLNDTMLVVWRKASTFNFRSQLSTWIFGIAYRKAMKAISRQDDEPPLDDAWAESAPSDEAGPDRRLEDSQTRAILA